ncbi:hypothetical protein AAMO2058_000493500 [Amorphochlora amoebiformis]|uniref:F-box/LRR-repeat protein 15-like leucin rich repeat domain-containing protein n=1 Tax=Amorphochlora amoebiformis TaxID=1561963 RepID=A0A7S0DUR9_9EUKA|mmetsp:Transcript_73/g.92  ORF Transcript_73/g.92 Transcript_73/m.92 type:complete len:370 (+) Transcript_73:124-1233(+)
MENPVYTPPPSPDKLKPESKKSRRMSCQFSLKDRIRSETGLTIDTNLPSIGHPVSRTTSDSGYRMRNQLRRPILENMLYKKLKAIGIIQYRRQLSAEAKAAEGRKASASLAPQPAALHESRARYLWDNSSSVHLLSEMRSYLTPKERMRFCRVSKLWNSPDANMTISRLEVLMCPKMRDAYFISMLNKHKALRKINVIGCSLLTDKCLEDIASRAPKLKTLNVSYCLQLTDRGLRHLEDCKHLRRLHTAACNKISDEAMEQLYKKCDTLQRPFVPIPRLTRQDATYGQTPLSFSPRVDDQKQQTGSSIPDESTPPVWKGRRRRRRKRSSGSSCASERSASRRGSTSRSGWIWDSTKSSSNISHKAQSPV